MLKLVWQASYETLVMVGLSTMLAALMGGALGCLLCLLRMPEFVTWRFIARGLSLSIDILRAVPFIILMIAIMPITRLLLGTSIGTGAAVVPLTISAAPFVARLVESALEGQGAELVEMGMALGASPWVILWRILWPEAWPVVVRGLILTAVTLVGYSAMAGTLGGGGLGDLAIRYGYQRFDQRMMGLTVALLVGLVYVLQGAGNMWVKRLYQKRGGYA